MDEKILEGYISSLKEEVSEIKKHGEDMESSSFNYQQGVLLSGNETQEIINILQKISDIKSDDRILNQTVLLNFIRQWTHIEEKGKLPDFKNVLTDFLLDYILD